MNEFGLETPWMRAAAKARFHGYAKVVSSQLKAAADEKSFDDGCSNASDLIGEDVQEESRSFIDGVSQLLANAPAGRA